jgi:hypothetical protein
MDRRFEGWSTRGGARGRALLLACVGVALILGVARTSANRSFPRWRSRDLTGDDKLDMMTANFNPNSRRFALSVMKPLHERDGTAAEKEEDLVRK